MSMGCENMSKNYFMNGITDLLILSLLDGKDRYMYEIVKCIEDFSGGVLSISQNTVYAAAYKLENDGRISEYSKLVGKRRTRVYYRLEEDGRAYLEELRDSYRNTTKGVQNILTILDREEDKDE